MGAGTAAEGTSGTLEQQMMGPGLEPDPRTLPGGSVPQTRHDQNLLRTICDQSDTRTASVRTQGQDLLCPSVSKPPGDKACGSEHGVLTDGTLTLPLTLPLSLPPTLPPTLPRTSILSGLWSCSSP